MEGPNGGVAPGWYRDPAGRDQLRWWDGQEWTGDVQPREEPEAARGSSDPGTSQASGPVTHQGMPTGRGRRAALMTLATLLTVGGSIAGGVSVGWTLADERAARQDTDAPEPVEDDLPAVSFDENPSDRHMPDVRGLDAETALEVLADAGIAPAAVSMEEQPWAGTVGVIVEQEPRFASPNPEEVTLRVSEPASVPDLIGDDADAAATELEDLGAIVRSVQRYEAGADAGTVLSSDPDPGMDLAPEIEIEVAAPSSSVFLASIPLVEGNCDRGEIEVDGQDHPDALTCRIRGDEVEHEWVLSRVVARIEGTIGVPDTGSSDAAVSVEILADGETIDTVSTSYGQPATIDVSVPDALRLTLRSRAVGEDEDDSTPTTDLVLADLRLIGGSDDLNRLRDDS